MQTPIRQFKCTQMCLHPLPIAMNPKVGKTSKYALDSTIHRDAITVYCICFALGCSWPHVFQIAGRHNNNYHQTIRFSLTKKNRREEEKIVYVFPSPCITTHRSLFTPVSGNILEVLHVI